MRCKRSARALAFRKGTPGPVALRVTPDRTIFLPTDKFSYVRFNVRMSEREEGNNAKKRTFKQARTR